MGGAFSRRSFLASTALGVASGCNRREGSAPPPDGSVAPQAPKGLTPNAISTLKAAMARLLPSDSDGPGAEEAGCADYLRIQMQDPSLTAIAREMEVLAKVLDVAARKQARVAFTALDGALQDELLHQAQHATIHSPRGFDAAHAFQVLLTFTLEGFLSDPRHGGNKGGVGWTFAKFTPHAGHR